MAREKTLSVRRADPALWNDLAGAAREIVGDWTDDEIANVMSKVRCKERDKLLDDIGHVLCWCAAAMKSGDDEAVACVELWQMDGLPIEIEVGANGEVSHRLEPDAAISQTGAIPMPDPLRKALSDLAYLTIRDLVAVFAVVVFVAVVVSWGVALEPVEEPVVVEERGQ